MRAPAAYYLGGSIGLSGSVTLRNDSRARLPLTLDDVMKKDRQETSSMATPSLVCAPCGAPQRTNLINMKCRYYHSFQGCTRPDCRFLHDEKPGDVVFHDETVVPRAYIPSGPHANLKVFVGNLPPGTVSSFVIDIAKPFGEVKRCDVLRSSLSNGRCPAILHMTSDAQATAVVNAFNAYIADDGQRFYARKQYSQPAPETAPPLRLKILTQSTKSFTQAKTRTAATPSSPLAQKKPKKPALVADDDGFFTPTKTSKIGSDFRDPLRVASSFSLLADLPEDWENAYERDNDECVDCEVAVITTPTKESPIFSDRNDMPMLNASYGSPVSTITGDWACPDASRRERVMSPFPMPPPADTPNCPAYGWCLLAPTDYSES